MSDIEIPGLPFEQSLQNSPTPLAQLFDLTGKVALITGGSRGLGLQIAEALGEYGARIVLVARKGQDLEAAARHMRARGVDAHTFVADLSGDGAADTLVSSLVEQFGRIDILVNNAGATWGERAEDYPISGWNKVLSLNVTGLFQLTQAVARVCFIGQGGGKVLNVASIEGLQGHHHEMPGMIAYNTAKGAVVNMTRALAAEWGRYGINVNALAPGYFPSKLTSATIDQHGERLVAGTPLGRLGGRNDLKGAALLLTSDAGRHITGQILPIDGGATVI